MNENNMMYKEGKSSRWNMVLWVIAILAIGAVTGLYLYGKTIHDGLV